MARDDRSRWRAFLVVSLGVLMIIVDRSIVNVALPSIKADLGFAEVQLVWVVNAYTLAFSGFLLVGGRLGDVFGPRRLFLLGIALFTAASAGCGLASSRTLLVGARLAQGVGGAIVNAVSFSLMMSLFAEGAERARAMGLYSFVSCCGGIFGLLLGGVLTSLLGWHWIFLINLPLGVAVYALCGRLLPDDPESVTRGRLDLAGATVVTAASLLAVYAIVNVNEAGWRSAQTATLLGGAAVCQTLFLLIESRVQGPLVPLSLFRRRTFTIANIIFILWCFATSAWFFIAALYLQGVAHYTPAQVGLAFAPVSLTAAALSPGVAPKLVACCGIKRSLCIGLLFTAGGLALFARAPVHASLAIDVLPTMLLMGAGFGIAPNPMMLAAMSGAMPGESGLISGIVNTGGLIAGALGLAMLASIASARTTALLAGGATLPDALNAGYHAAFLIGAAFLLVAILIAAGFLRAPPSGCA